MKITRASVTPFALPLRSSFRTASGTMDCRPGFALVVETEGGLVGCGEASPLAVFGTESQGECEIALGLLAERLRGCVLDDIESFLDAAERLAPEAPAARAACDTALHDLLARREGVSLSALLLSRYGGVAGSGSRAAPNPQLPVNALIGGEDRATLLRAALAAQSAGYRVLKLKLGTRPLTEELGLVEALLGRGTDALQLRLDVNGGWNEQQAEEAIAVLNAWPIESLEQPLPADELHAMARLRAQARFALAADEAILGPGALERVITLSAADRVVLKPAALGGLRSSWHMAERARAAGLQVLVTSFIDSSVGVHAAWHLAAALPGELPACGLATGGLLSRDLSAPLPPVQCGSLGPPPGPGLGVAFDAGALRRCASGPGQHYGGVRPGGALWW